MRLLCDYSQHGFDNGLCISVFRPRWRSQGQALYSAVSFACGRRAGKSGVIAGFGRRLFWRVRSGLGNAGFHTGTCYCLAIFSPARGRSHKQSADKPWRNCLSTALCRMSASRGPSRVGRFCCLRICAIIKAFSGKDADYPAFERWPAPWCKE